MKENQNKIVHYLGTTEHQTPLSITQGEYKQPQFIDEEVKAPQMDINKGFNSEDIKILKELKLYEPKGYAEA